MPRPPTTTVDDLISFLKVRGPLKGPEIAAGLKISQPTFSRLVKAAGTRLFSDGKKRNATYGATREIRELGKDFPVFKVAKDGKCIPLGTLQAIYPRSYAYRAKDSEGTAELFPGIPFFLSDHRPQGFMGRFFPKRHPDMQLPARIVDWNEEDVMEAICRRGEDAPGNLIVGKESFERYQTNRLQERKLLEESILETYYGNVVNNLLQEEEPGSSAAGEQPKFTVSFEKQEKIIHAIVKFSPRATDFRGRRWMDLLIAESISLNLLSEYGSTAASNRILEVDERIFLEAHRFDRVGRWGRVGAITLGPIEDEWFGRRDNWVSAAGRLLEKGFIEKKDAEAIKFLYSFGCLIGNNDLHFGNLTFFYEVGRDALSLAPVYDMLPMLYAPSQIDGDREFTRDFRISPALPDAIAQWNAALPIAAEFWERVTRDDRVSLSFRSIAKENAKLLNRARQS